MIKQKAFKDLQNEDQNKLYEISYNHVSKPTLRMRNQTKSWKYGYDEKYDMIVISKTGKIGDIYKIQDLYVALPYDEGKSHKRSNKHKEQYWERQELPKPLEKIKTIYYFLYMISI